MAANDMTGCAFRLSRRPCAPVCWQRYLGCTKKGQPASRANINQRLNCLLEWDGHCHHSFRPCCANSYCAFFATPCTASPAELLRRCLFLGAVTSAPWPRFRCCSFKLCKLHGLRLHHFLKHAAPLGNIPVCAWPVTHASMAEVLMRCGQRKVSLMAAWPGR